MRSETTYFAEGGSVYARTPDGVQEAGTALSADGRDLERHDRALAEAKRQREHHAAKSHHIGTRTNRRGGSMIAGGGNFRDSSVYCSCGWEEHQNGQTRAESDQFAREHLKEMGVYNTQGEQTIYAFVSGTLQTVERISAKSSKSVGLVQKAMNKFVARGNVERVGDAYRRTDRWFSWND